jgi:hypothetical protein
MVNFVISAVSREEYQDVSIINFCGVLTNLESSVASIYGILKEIIKEESKFVGFNKFSKELCFSWNQRIKYDFKYDAALNKFQSFLNLFAFLMLD